MGINRSKHEQRSNLKAQNEQWVADQGDLTCAQHDEITNACQSGGNDAPALADSMR
jgi:hypothetical protein